MLINLLLLEEGKNKKRACNCFVGYLRPVTARQHTLDMTTPEAKHTNVRVCVDKLCKVAVYRYPSEQVAEFNDSAMEEILMVGIGVMRTQNSGRNIKSYVKYSLKSRFQAVIERKIDFLTKDFF